MLCEIPSFAKPIRCSGRAVLSWFINFPVSSCLTSSKFSAASREISNCLIFSPPACFIALDEERLEADIPIAIAPSDDQLLAVNEALEKLATVDKPKAELVKLRYFV